jgi:hypothetical protein
LNNNNSNPLRFLKELIDDNKSGKKKPQSRNSKSKGRNYKKKSSNINSSIELNNEYNYNYYLVEAGLDKSSKISGNKHSGKSTGAQPSNSVHNLSINTINGLNNLNLTKYSQNNVGYFNLNYHENSVNNSKIMNKKGNNKSKAEKENQININNDRNEININKNKGALSLDKNINKMKFNSFINKNIQINNFVNNNEPKKNIHGPIILNENNIKRLKNFNMTIFNMPGDINRNSSIKEKNINFILNNNKRIKNSSIKEKKINFNLSNNKKINNNINNINHDANKNKNLDKNIFNNNNNKNFLKFSNKSLLKSICLQKQNSRNFFNDSVKKNNIKNMPKKLSEKSVNVKEKPNEKQDNVSRNSKINYEKLIKSFEI